MPPRKISDVEFAEALLLRQATFQEFGTLLNATTSKIFSIECGIPY